MKVMSPKFWFAYHAAMLADGMSAAIAHWHTNTPKVKWLIIMDAGLLVLLLFLFAWFSKGQN